MIRYMQRLMAAVVIVLGLMVAPVTSSFASTAHPALVSLTSRGGGSSGSSGGTGGSHSFGGSSGGTGGTRSRGGTSGGGTSHSFGGSSGGTSGSTGRGVKAPTGTGNRAAAPTLGKITIGSKTRASGSTYTEANGYTYRYSSTTYRTYYTTYHGGYPTYGSLLYWQLMNDPFYLPNYANPLSVWYNHPYPAGYTVSNGMFVAPASSGFLTALLWIVIIAAIVIFVVVVVRVLKGRRSGGSNRSSGDYGRSI